MCTVLSVVMCSALCWPGIGWPPPLLLPWLVPGPGCTQHTGGSCRRVWELRLTRYSGEIGMMTLSANQRPEMHWEDQSEAGRCLQISREMQTWEIRGQGQWQLQIWCQMPGSVANDPDNNHIKTLICNISGIKYRNRKPLVIYKVKYSIDLLDVTTDEAGS